MQVMDSWKESLKSFERKNILLLGLITLRTIARTYKNVFKYLGILIFFVVFVNMFFQQRMSGAILQLWQSIAWCFWIIFLVFVYLSARPSVMKKNWLYYKTFLTRGLFVALRLGIIFAILPFIGYQWWMLIGMLVTLEIFFYLDAGRKNLLGVYLVPAAKMMLYNLPVCIAVMAMFAVIWYLYMVLVQLVRMVVPISIGDVSFLFMPVGASLYVNLYVKWLHEQFALYYTQHVQKDGQG